MAVVEGEEVVGLEQAVGEFGVGDALVARLQADAHRVPGHHGVDREVLADVAQEADEVELAQPFEVVDQQGAAISAGAARPGAEVEEALELAAQTGEVGRDLLASQHRPFGIPARGVADQAGAAAHQGDRAVAGALQTGESQHRQQAPDVQAGGRRVEPDVGGEALLAHLVAQLGRGRLVDQPALLEVGVEVVGHLGPRLDGLPCRVAYYLPFEGCRERGRRRAGVSRGPLADTELMSGRGTGGHRSMAIGGTSWTGRISEVSSRWHASGRRRQPSAPPTPF